jgi:hypothetical protein
MYAGACLISFLFTYTYAFAQRSVPDCPDKHWQSRSTGLAPEKQCADVIPDKAGRGRHLSRLRSKIR